MHPIRNPFIAGGPVPPERFVGRAKEVYAIMGRLTATTFFWSTTRGSGFSIINSDQVKQDWSISSKNFTFVYLDCGGIDDPLFVNFWKTLFIKIGK
jgi:hypothetical protein